MEHLLLIFLLVATAAGGPLDGRIFDGDGAAPGQFPFIVSINDPDQFCDGSIIDTKWIVTAAHCLGTITDSTTVRVGTNLEHSGGTSYHVVTTIPHEDFDHMSGKNDIGLIKIDGELDFGDLIQKIEFIDPEVGAVCTAIGWGITESTDFPEEVQYVQLKTIDLADCGRRSEGYMDNMYLGPEQVCTLAPEGKGTCYGDSGGPLICDGKLAGIVAYGVVPCAKGYPDIYTKPSVYSDWIKKNIQE